MNFITRWFTDRVVQIEVDYSKPLYIPQGAIGVCRHAPVGRGHMSLLPNSLDLRTIEPGTTYVDYITQNSREALCDAAVLDGIVAYVLSKETKKKSRYEVLEGLFGDFRGQVFFLGTTFMSNTGVECVAYLNVRTLQPYLRYACPIQNPMNHDFEVRVCHLAPMPLILCP